MEISIFIFAVIAFIVALVIIFFKEIKGFLKKKFSKKPNIKKEASNKEKKSTYQVEDFKPIVYNTEGNVRDSSLESLFAFDEYGMEEQGNEEGFTTQMQDKENFGSSLTDADRKRLDDFFGKDNNFFKHIDNRVPKRAKGSISDEIKNLSPEMKALLLDNVLKKRDDV